LTFYEIINIRMVEEILLSGEEHLFQEPRNEDRKDVHEADAKRGGP
jgi:hypothetical protein